jgi:hypothetical protein
LGTAAAQIAGAQMTVFVNKVVTPGVLNFSGLRRNLWVTLPITAAEPLIDRRNRGAAQKT